MQVLQSQIWQAVLHLEITNVRTSLFVSCTIVTEYWKPNHKVIGHTNGSQEHCGSPFQIMATNVIIINLMDVMLRNGLTKMSIIMIIELQDVLKLLELLWNLLKPHYRKSLLIWNLFSTNVQYPITQSDVMLMLVWKPEWQLLLTAQKLSLTLVLEKSISSSIWTQDILSVWMNLLLNIHRKPDHWTATTVLLIFHIHPACKKVYRNWSLHRSKKMVYKNLRTSQNQFHQPTLQPEQSYLLQVLINKLTVKRSKWLVMLHVAPTIFVRPIVN